MSYTCPYCQITSHNPNDEQHKYCRNCHKFEDEPRVTAEQQARDMLERMNIDDAQSFTAGDLIELANLISEVNAYRRGVAAPPPPVVWDQQPPAPETLRAAVVDVLKLLVGA